jgi:phage-related protein
MSDWTIIYYHNRKGEKVVRQEIESFDLVNQARIVTLIGILAKYGFNLCSHHIKHIKGKIWEIRIDRCRILYVAFRNHCFLLLRAFIKKTNKTPTSEIKIALNRLNDYITRTGE